jgi:hypothetical protein
MRTPILCELVYAFIILWKYNNNGGRMVSRLFFDVGIKKPAGCILSNSCGHPIYWSLGGRYETSDTSNIVAKPCKFFHLRYQLETWLR